MAAKAYDFRASPKKVRPLSLQRGRERYILIQTWKIANSEAPNDINMSFKETLRQGINRASTTGICDHLE